MQKRYYLALLPVVLISAHINAGWWSRLFEHKKYEYPRYEEHSRYEPEEEIGSFLGEYERYETPRYDRSRYEHSRYQKQEPRYYGREHERYQYPRYERSRYESRRYENSRHEHRSYEHSRYENLRYQREEL